jgi:glyoxylase-like metal-dependent hydrolase (beta-lactamase superfamily II)
MTPLTVRDYNRRTLVRDPILIPAHNPGPTTGSGNNTYLIPGADRATLIDAGQGRTAHLNLLADHLARESLPLRTVLVTHAHADHASGAPALASAHSAAEFRKHPWPTEDRRYPVPWRPLGDLDAIDLGGDRLVAMHTPGHAPDHFAFWHESTRTVFGGDLVVAGGSVMIQASRGGSLADYLASLQRVAALTPARLLPAHGPPIDEPGRILAQYLAHRLQREAQVLAALSQGRGTVQAIADSIYHGLDPALLPAAHETVRAHLEKLRHEGRARIDGDRWTR